MNIRTIKAYVKLKKRFPDYHVALEVSYDRFKSGKEKLAYLAYVCGDELCESVEDVSAEEAVNKVILLVEGGENSDSK